MQERDINRIKAGSQALNQQLDEAVAIFDRRSRELSELVLEVFEAEKEG